MTDPVCRPKNVAAGALVVTAISLGAIAPAQAGDGPVASTTGTVTQSVVREPLATGSAERDQFEAKVIRLTNRARAKPRRCGDRWMRPAKRVRWDPQLGAAAHAHSADMATKDYFSHTSPSGATAFDRIRLAGYQYRAAGENIAAGRSLATPRDVVKTWLRSPGHCRNLMKRTYRDIGVGLSTGPGEWHVYWAQVFGRSL